MTTEGFCLTAKRKNRELEVFGDSLYLGSFFGLGGNWDLRKSFWGFNLTEIPVIINKKSGTSHTAFFI